jgi:hypothetical protein
MATNPKPLAPAPTPVRLAADLRIWLQHQAVDNHRSLSGEITFRLKESRLKQVNVWPHDVADPPA